MEGKGKKKQTKVTVILLRFTSVGKALAQCLTQAHLIYTTQSNDYLLYWIKLTLFEFIQNKGTLQASH